MFGSAARSWLPRPLLMLAMWLLAVAPAFAQWAIEDVHPGHRVEHSSLALDAANGIATVLNALSPIPVNVSDGINTRAEYLVFSDIVILSPGPGLPALSTELYGGAYAEDQNAWQTFFTSRATTSSLLMAHFSPVPIPQAFWLFGAGLLGLIEIARRNSE